MSLIALVLSVVWAGDVIEPFFEGCKATLCVGVAGFDEGGALEKKLDIDCCFFWEFEAIVATLSKELIGRGFVSRLQRWEIHLRVPCGRRALGSARQHRILGHLFPCPVKLLTFSLRGLLGANPPRLS